METDRVKAITRTSVIGIIANVFLSLVKMLAGALAGSIAVVLDALNNLTDAMSSIITIAGIKLARKRPDNKHPYGYGRIEYFSTILISFLILFAGVTSIIESVKKIITPELPDYTWITIAVIVVSVITKLILGRFVKKQGEKYNSDALIASGADASFDAVISASTLIGAVVIYFFEYSVDGFIGAIISAVIIKAGIGMLLDALSDVMGNRPDSELTRAIKADIKGVPGVMGAYDLVLHNYGPSSAIGSVHVEVPAEITAAEFNVITSKIQHVIAEKYRVFLTVGSYAIETADENKMKMREHIREIVAPLDGVVNVHGIHIEDNELISFDATVDFSVRDISEFAAKIQKLVEAEYPGYRAEINIDTNYSD